jgi:hypothetical protein
MKSETGLDRFLSMFINAWLTLVALFTVASFAGTISDAPSFWDGLSAVWGEIMGIKLYATLILFLSPAIAALWWKEQRRRHN